MNLILTSSSEYILEEKFKSRGYVVVKSHNLSYQKRFVRYI
jgi:hypothetical protein